MNKIDSIIEGIATVADTDTNGLKWEDDIKAYLCEATKGFVLVPVADMAGLRYSPTWHTWASMVKRCTNPNNNRYYLYGGRGISVCSEWRSFAGFVSDMGIKPEGKTIDRIDFNKGYFKSNCQWATNKEQANNKRNNHIVTANGLSMTLSQWADKTGIASSTIRLRIKRGWTQVDAVTKPVKRKAMLSASQQGE